MKKKVAIVRCAAYGTEEAYGSVKRAVDLLGGLKGFVKPGERILLKPNLLAPKPPEAAVTTHPAVVGALIRLVKEAGATPVVGDSPGLGSARKAAEKSGILGACEREGAAFMEFKEVVLKENTAGHTFKRFEVAREALDVDGIINIPKLKTHAQMLLTMGVKNVFGCVPGKLKPQWHLSAGVDSTYFGAMILDLYLCLNPRLTVMDAVTAMEGNGPGSGTPRDLGLLFASADAIAMDTVAATLLGARLRDIPIHRAASLRGIKETEAKNVDIVGAMPEKVKDFRFPPIMDTNFTARLPYFIDRPLRRALTSRPHITHSSCTLCNVCVETCPAEIMERSDRITIDYDRCIRCWCCQEMCPHGAISSKEGWMKRIIPGL